MYAFSASKTLISRVPGFPTFEKSGLKRKEYIDCLQSHIINMSGNEASSEESFSNDDSDSEDNLIRNYLQPVCPCDEIKFLNALKENEDVNDSESEFHSGDWYSSGYSTTDDETYVPHLGNSKFSEKDDDQNRKLPPKEREESEEREKSEEYEESEESEESEEVYRKSAKKQKLHIFNVPLETPLPVLPMPPWRSTWKVHAKNSMKPVLNNIKLKTLSFFATGLRQPTILYRDIPEVNCGMFGRYKFMVTFHSQKYSVSPNVVIGQTNEELYFIAPNQQWYQLQRGLNRERQ